MFSGDNQPTIAEKSSQEITEQYMPKMGPILEEEVYEEDCVDVLDLSKFSKETTSKRFVVQDKKVENFQEQETVKQKICISTITPHSVIIDLEIKKNKSDSTKRVTLPEEDEHQKEEKRKIRKTPFISKTIKEEQDDELDVDIDAEQKREEICGLWKQIQALPTAGKNTAKATTSPVHKTADSSTNVTRSLNFSEMLVAGQEVNEESKKDEVNKSPLYKNLFGNFGGKEQIVEAAKKVVVSKKNTKEKRKVEVGKNKGFGQEGRRRVVEMFRSSSYEEDLTRNSFEDYLLGNVNWKQLETSPKQNSGEHLSEFLFSDVKPEYLKWK